MEYFAGTIRRKFLISCLCMKFHLKIDSSHRLILALIVILALVLRILFLLDLQKDPVFYVPYLDAEYHDTLAQNLAKGEMPPAPFFRAPLYIFFLGGIYAVFGHNYNTAVLIQFIICLLYTSPSPRDRTRSRMPSSA